ncbi:MAG: 4-(cytidine 5'-diphospho)-2-C-methyl-D-erythritol kinase [Coriobacteriia bacterium]|nr:4-(cytidine 5'-diphospho)-2-C-methyl-D-erythritol kinase [Coriobacteriia bacterium]
MRIISPAKINLSLSVGPLQDDGYHQVDSFFHLISLHDVLIVQPSETFGFTSSVDLGIPEADNLVIKAAKGMARLHNKELPAVHIGLEKNIPHGAGLGGGSSNAAASIFALATLWNLPPSDSRHLELAASLGSDVPLFLASTTASVMTGRGEVLKESRDPLPQTSLLVLMPSGAHSPTGAVYKAFDKNPQPTHSVDIWQNNLEPAAIEVSPKTGEALNWLRAQNEVKIAQVAGSGSACWAQLTTDHDAKAVAQRAVKQGYWAIEVSTVQEGIHIHSDNQNIPGTKA